MVRPPASTRLHGASQVTVPMGHSSLVISDEVYRRLVAMLRRPVRDADELVRAVGR